MKKQLLFGALSIIMLGALITSCEKKEESTPSVERITITETGTGCTPIYAGQNTLAGDVCLQDIDTNNDGTPDVIRVTYSTTGSWRLYEIQFAVGNATSCIPMTRKGNLIPGQFPHKFTNLGGVATYTFDVPFNAACLNYTCGNANVIYGAAHCVVGIPGGATETGWGNGSYVPGNSWGSIFSFTIDCDDEEPPPANCETAFAYGNASATCFLNIDDPCDSPNNAFNRWGWSNGPYAPGTYTMPLYAGAGQCNLSNGTNVGTVTVNYSGSTVTVSYSLTGAFNLDEAHVYVGNNVLPGPTCDWTVAPGQYPVVAENLSGTSYSTTFNNVSGSIYIVAHAVVCGF
ncbi:MAG: hypothetical protein ACK5C5_11435 [Bacteroidota bacterium]|jgi:hypothetical protein